MPELLVLVEEEILDRNFRVNELVVLREQIVHPANLRVAIEEIILSHQTTCFAIINVAGGFLTVIELDSQIN